MKPVLISAISPGPQQLEVFAVLDNRKMATLSLPNGVPSPAGWLILEGATFASPPAVASPGATLPTAVFGLETHGQICAYDWDHKDWGAIPECPTSFLSGPAVAWADGAAEVVVLGADTVQHLRLGHDALAGWSAPFPNKLITSPPAVVCSGKNQLDVFALGRDEYLLSGSTMYWTGETHGGDEIDPQWRPLQSLGGIFRSGPRVTPGSPGPAAVSWAAGRLDVFAIGVDYGMHWKVYDGTKWSPDYPRWHELGGRFDSAPAAVARAEERLDVFTLGTDGAMYWRTYDRTRWSPEHRWFKLGGQFISAPTATSWGPDRLDVFAIGTDQRMHHRWWDGSGWRPQAYWEPLGAPVGRRFLRVFEFDLPERTHRNLTASIDV